MATVVSNVELDFVDESEEAQEADAPANTDLIDIAATATKEVEPTLANISDVDTGKKDDVATKTVVNGGDLSGVKDIPAADTKPDAGTDVVSGDSTGSYLSVVSTLLDKFGYNEDQSYLETLDLNSEESIFTCIKDILEDEKSSMFASNEVAELNTFVRKGGKIEDFLKRPDTKIDYTALDYTVLENKKSLATAYFTSIGNSAAETSAVIAEMIENDELTANVNFMAKHVTKYEANLEKIKRSEMLAEQAAELERKSIAEQEFRNRIANTSSIAGVNFSSNADRNGFIAFIKDKTPTGLTAYETIVKNKDAELALQMMAYKGYHKNKVVSIAESEKNKHMQAALKDLGKSSSSKKAVLPASTVVKNEVVDMTNLSFNY